MLIVDSQVHLWGAGTPSPRHRQEPFTASELLREMDEAGVARAIIVPPNWDPHPNVVAIEAARRYPDRFAVMGVLDLADPASPAKIPTWKSQAGMLGLRLVFSTPTTRPWLHDGTADWIWPAAENAGLPIMLLVPGSLPEVAGIAKRYPGLRLTIDGLGIPYGLTGQAAFAHLDELLSVAQCPNIAVKASGIPETADGPYPFAQVEKPLRRIYNAFGPERMFWGTDLTRMPCSYRQCVTHFTETLAWLQGGAKAAVMGRAVCDWIGWPMPGEA